MLPVGLTIYVVDETRAFFTENDPIQLGSSLAINLTEAFGFGVVSYVFITSRVHHHEPSHSAIAVL